MEQKTIMYVVLALISIIFVALLIRKFAFVTDIDQAQCEKSIQAHIGLQELTKGEVKSLIKCPTIYQKIVGTKPESVNKQVAEGMRKCWGLWMEGEHPLFSDKGVFCHICRVFEFDKKGNIIPGIQTYMDTTLIPGEKITYTEYLAPSATENFEELVPEGFDASIMGNEEEYRATHTGSTIDTNYDYASVFVFARGQNWISNAIDFARGRANVLVGGGVASLMGGSAFVYDVVGIVTGTIMATPPGWIIGGVVLTAAGVWALYTAAEGGEEAWMSMIMLVVYDQESLQELDCSILPVEQLQK